MQCLHLSPEAWLEWHSGWLASVQASQLQHDLVHQLTWEQRHIVLFGKPVLQPRLIAWAGALPYRYSGQTLEPKPAPECLAPVWQRVIHATTHDFNHVLINRYRDGNDSMGYHADAEPELGALPVVASLSLGQPRRFVIQSRDKSTGGKPQQLLLGHGDLLVMRGTCQRDFRHALPRDRTPNLGERVSLTFRHVLCVPRATAHLD